MIEDYTVETFGGDEVRIAIDTNKISEKTIKELNDFWAASEDRVLEARGDITRAYVKFLAEHALGVASSNLYNHYGVMRWYDDAEGFCKMDGSAGILIHYCSVMEYDACIVRTHIANEMPSKPKGNM